MCRSIGICKRATKNLPRRSKFIGIISVVVIVGASYGLFFYFQTITEKSIRNNLFERQAATSTDSTKALSEHIGSDLDSIMSKLQGLANSLYLQQGELSSNQTKNMLKQVYLSMTSANIVDRLFVLNRSDVAVVSLAAKRRTIIHRSQFFK